MFGVIVLPAFALQAALRHQPFELRQEPVVILGGDGETKPIIYQCNNAATAAGVRGGMTSSQGLARCSVLRLLPRSPAQESAVAEALLESAFSCSPWVEATAEGVCTFELRDTRPADGCLGHGKLDGQHVPLLARGKVSRCVVDRVNRRVWEGGGLEARRFLGVAVIPKADRVLCWLGHMYFHDEPPEAGVKRMRRNAGRAERARTPRRGPLRLAHAAAMKDAR